MPAFIKKTPWYVWLILIFGLVLVLLSLLSPKAAGGLAWAMVWMSFFIIVAMIVLFGIIYFVRRKKSGHAAHAHGTGHEHKSNFLEVVIALAFVVAVGAYVAHVIHEQGQPPSLSTWNQRVPPQSGAPSAVVETVSTRPVPFAMPVGSWYVIEGETGFNVKVCRASDTNCLEKVPIGFRMRCVTMTNETVEWSPAACESFLRLMVQSTGTEPLAGTYRYVPK